MITELTRLCPSCRATLPDPPAPAVCPRCATVAVPHVRDWDPRVRYFLMAAYASRHAFLSFDSAQAAHEKLLMGVIAWAGEGKHGHPFGHLGITCETRAADCYPLALQLAIHWRAIGAPLEHDLLLRIGRETKLIPETHPLLKRAG
jgi:hypothetical protein